MDVCAGFAVVSFLKGNSKGAAATLPIIPDVPGLLQKTIFVFSAVLYLFELFRHTAGNHKTGHRLLTGKPERFFAK